MYGLKPDTIKCITSVFEKEPAVEKVILYGSRAKGNYRQGSDIDLTLEGENLDLTILQRMENDIDDLMLPYKLDLSLLKHIRNTELLDHIEQVGKVFYVKDVNQGYNDTSSR